MNISFKFQSFYGFCDISNSNNEKELVCSFHLNFILNGWKIRNIQNDKKFGNCSFVFSLTKSLYKWRINVEDTNSKYYLFPNVIFGSKYYLLIDENKYYFNVMNYKMCIIYKNDIQIGFIKDNNADESEGFSADLSDDEKNIDILLIAICAICCTIRTPTRYSRFGFRFFKN